MKQLASKHALYVDGGDGKTNYTFTSESLEKFAESLVTVCADIVTEQQFGNPGFGNKIKEKFGVK
jgi:hypothetical protein